MTCGTSHSDAVGVGQGDVADPALRRAGLDGRQAQEADLQARSRDLGQLEAQSDRTDLQHGGRAEAGDLQLKSPQSHFHDESIQTSHFEPGTLKCSHLS